MSFLCHKLLPTRLQGSSYFSYFTQLFHCVNCLAFRCSAVADFIVCTKLALAGLGSLFIKCDVFFFKTYPLLVLQPLSFLALWVMMCPPARPKYLILTHGGDFSMAWVLSLVAQCLQPCFSAKCAVTQGGCRETPDWHVGLWYVGVSCLPPLKCRLGIMVYI